MQPPLSILVPTLDETHSLAQTVDLLFSEPAVPAAEVILIVCEKTTPATMEVCRRLRATNGERVRIIEQTLPLLGGAFRSGIAAATGSHILLMFADLESDPRIVPVLVTRARANPGSIISASRWVGGGGFIGYPPTKRILNYFFQRLCRVLWNSQLTDFTYGFRLYPSSILKNTDWHETDHAFVLEAILRPLVDRIPICEIPAVWRTRKDGTKRSRFRQYLRYVPAMARIAVAQYRRQRLRTQRVATSARTP